MVFQMNFVSTFAENLRNPLYCQYSINALAYHLYCVLKHWSSFATQSRVNQLKTLTASTASSAPTISTLDINDHYKDIDEEVRKNEDAGLAEGLATLKSNSSIFVNDKNDDRNLLLTVCDSIINTFSIFSTNIQVTPKPVIPLKRSRSHLSNGMSITCISYFVVKIRRSPE